jgi:hypothetical protein
MAATPAGEGWSGCYDRCSTLLAYCNEKFVLIYNKLSLMGFDESSSGINVRARRMVP